MRFGGIAFDMDGVLVDSGRCHASAFDRLWTDLGVDGPDYADIAGRPTRDVVVEVTRGLGPDPLAIDAWVRTKQLLARDCLAHAEILFPDVEPTLDSLGDRYTLALVTGGSRPTVESTLARYGLGETFSVVVTGDDVSEGKPAPEAYDRAASAIVDTPDLMLVVEDSGNGIRSGLDAGAFVVSVRTGETQAHDRFLGAFESLTDAVSSLGLVG